MIKKYRNKKTPKKAIILALLAVVVLALCASEVWAGCVWVCDDNTTVITEQKDKDGRRTVWTEEIRDDKGELIRRRVDTYTYYPNGNIKDIRQQIMGPDGKSLSEKTVTHYSDR